MSSRLPERIDPGRLVEQGRVVEGRYELGLMPRLATLLSDNGGEVEFVFEFTRDAQNRPIVRSHVWTDLCLTCQRCLGPLEFRVDNRNTLALVEGLDEAQAIPEEYESFLVEEPTVRLRDMVEEELLLGIPAFPKHEQLCGTNPDGPADVIEDDPLDNPFGVLSALRNGNERTD